MPEDPIPGEPEPEPEPAVPCYFDLMPLIRTRLIEQLADVIPETQILTGFDVGRVAAGTIVYPCVFVIYLGDDSIEAGGYNACELIAQRWQVVGCVRNVSSTRESSELMTEAGVLVSRVIRALRGWSPRDGATPLKRVPAEKASYPSMGLAFFPTEFVVYFEDSI